MLQAKWGAPVTNKLLFDAGASLVPFGWRPARQPGVTPTRSR